jgi:RNA polymerase sigma-70 factor (ECF subfamily)
VVDEGHVTEDPAVWQALAALSEDHRELLLLRYWDGLDVASIAVLLKVRPALVSSRLHKAKEKYRRELGRRDRGIAGEVTNESHSERSTR